MDTTIKINGTTISINDKSQESTHKSAAEIINGGLRTHNLSTNVVNYIGSTAQGGRKSGISKFRFIYCK